MGLRLPGYRVTSDDLPDADKKTLRAIDPLLDALNRSLSNVINSLNALVLPDAAAASFTKSGEFATDALTGPTAKFFPVVVSLDRPPKQLWLTALMPQLTAGEVDGGYNRAGIPSVPRGGGDSNVFAAWYSSMWTAAGWSMTWLPDGPGATLYFFGLAPKRAYSFILRYF